MLSDNGSIYFFFDQTISYVSAYICKVFWIFQNINFSNVNLVQYTIIVISKMFGKCTFEKKKKSYMREILAYYRFFFAPYIYEMIPICHVLLLNFIFLVKLTYLRYIYFEIPKYTNRECWWNEIFRFKAWVIWWMFERNG